jgi:hypothetical protein
MLLDHAYANSNVIMDGDVQELKILLIELKKIHFVTQVQGYEVKLQKVKSKGPCVSPFHVAMYQVALRYSLSEKVITQFHLDQLDVASLECDIDHTDYIKAMQMTIHQNAMRINCLENSLAIFQQTVVT